MRPSRRVVVLRREGQVRPLSLNGPVAGAGIEPALPSGALNGERRTRPMDTESGQVPASALAVEWGRGGRGCTVQQAVGRRPTGRVVRSRPAGTII